MHDASSQASTDSVPSRGEVLLAPPASPAVLGATRSFAALKAENSRLLRDDIAARRSYYRGLPEVVTLNHTDICNLRCIMCQRSLGQGKHRLDAQALDHVVNELFPTALKAVLTTAGGDPLAVDFDFLLERALRYDVRLDVVTNGLLLSPETYRNARGALDHLNVSLDTHRPDVYERIRAGSSFARVWGNLERIAEMRQREPDGVLFSLSAVVMRSNLPHLADFLRAVAPLWPDGIVLQRLQHTEKLTPEEEPYTAFSPEEIDGYFRAAEDTARELGMNLLQSEHRRANVLSTMPRPKLPLPLEGHGLCWFLGQNFNVMYTGEVYACCVPTDLCLGNVHYQDPAEIWNGEPFRRLREQHLSGEGNRFCSGCVHAPHLPPPPDYEALAPERDRLAKEFEVTNEVRRKAEALWRRPIYDPALPDVDYCDGGFADVPDRVTIATQAGEVEAAAPTRTGTVSLRAGWLEWRTAEHRLHRHMDLRAVAVGRGTCVCPLEGGAVLVGFENGGGLVRVDGESCVPVLRLSDPRSFVQSFGVSVAPDGTVWVGEYGVFPGARCAWLYRSSDGGCTFDPVTRFADARHMHRVMALADGTVLVTTGDLAAERRLYRGDAEGGFVCFASAWSGFVAASEHAGVHHFGTDLGHNNGLLALRGGWTKRPEFRKFPDDLELKVRSIVPLGNGTLLALLGMDENLPEARVGRRAALLASKDRGQSWAVVHRFAYDWSDEPTELIPLGGTRVWAIGGPVHHTIELARF